MARQPEDIEWDGYRAFQPGVGQPWHTLTRATARKVFDKVMAERHERVEALRLLLRANGLTLGKSDDAVEELEEWFYAHVEASRDDAARPRPLWLAVAFDIGIFLSELILERRPTLRWEFFVWGKRDVAYQRPVIMGFDLYEKHYNVDLVMLVSSAAFAVVQDERPRASRFMTWLYASNAGESQDPKVAYRRTRPNR